MDVYTWQEPNLWGVLDETLRIRIGVTEEGYLWISVDIQMWPDRPAMGNFTHGDTNRYALGEITISADGLLTAMHRHPAEHDFCSGFSLRVPLSFVSPLCQALEQATDEIHDRHAIDVGLISTSLRKEGGCMNPQFP